MKARSGSKTLIYGTAAGIDPHRINRSKLPPWYIAGPCYRSPPPPCQFPPFPSRSALRAVGQSSRTALLLLPVCLTPSAPRLSSLLPLRPVLQSHLGYVNGYKHLPAAPRGLEGKYVDNTKWLQIEEIQGLGILLNPKGIQVKYSDALRKKATKQKYCFSYFT